MTFSYEIFPLQRLISLRYTGTFTLRTMTETLHTLWDDPRYSRDYNGVVDLGRGEVGFSIEDLRGLIGLISAHEKTSRGSWAAVTTAPVATAILMLYRRAMLGRHAFEVFSSWDAACEFVGTDMSREASLRNVPVV